MTLLAYGETSDSGVCTQTESFIQQVLFHPIFLISLLPGIPRSTRLSVRYRELLLRYNGRALSAEVFFCTRGLCPVRLLHWFLAQDLGICRTFGGWRGEFGELLEILDIGGLRDLGGI